MDTPVGFCLFLGGGAVGDDDEFHARLPEFPDFGLYQVWCADDAGIQYDTGTGEGVGKAIGRIGAGVSRFGEGSVRHADAGDGHDVALLVAPVTAGVEHRTAECIAGFDHGGDGHTGVQVGRKHGDGVIAHAQSVEHAAGGKPVSRFHEGIADEALLGAGEIDEQVCRTLHGLPHRVGIEVEVQVELVGVDDVAQGVEG